MRTVTRGEQAPQIVSDWTGDVVLQGGQAAKVSYDIFSNGPDGKLSKKDEELVMKSVSGYSRFVGDFIARASLDSVENSELSDSEKDTFRKWAASTAFRSPTIWTAMGAT